jgi:hypothetical protein
VTELGVDRVVVPVGLDVGQAAVVVDVEDEAVRDVGAAVLALDPRDVLDLGAALGRFDHDHAFGGPQNPVDLDGEVGQGVEERGPHRFGGVVHAASALLAVGDVLEGGGGRRRRAGGPRRRYRGSTGRCMQ